MEKIDDFMSFVRKLKEVKRAGWLRYIHPNNAESVADHSYGVSLHFLAFSDQDLLINNKLADRNKCIMMSMIHDLAESIVGDFTPFDEITPQEKEEKERKAINCICSSLDKERAQFIINLWEEYEQGETPEAMLVKDADKLDMITQAFEYEKKHKVCLDEFYKSTEKIFKTNLFKTLNIQLRKKRQEYFLNPKP